MAAPSVDDFDFILMKIHDVHGYPRGRMMSKKRMPGIVQDGLGIYAGACYFGIRGEVFLHDDIGNNNYGNKILKPFLNTLKPCPQLGGGKFRVGQVLCRLEDIDGKLDTSVPRTAAEILIDRLHNELGLTVKSAFEIEFIIRDSESKQYFGHDGKWSSINALYDCQGLLFDLIQELDGRGVAIDSLQTEYGPGQFEFTLDVAEGIQAADNTLEFKNTVKTSMKPRGYEASFMTRADLSFGVSNGFHWNHSLWTSSGENAFVDLSKPHKLSELGCHWLAGLIEHAPAMTAFCNPTINCYRRIGQRRTPTFADWSVDGRATSFRLKVEGEDNVYIENRLPTSASNPHLVLACSLAAGIDGVKRKLPLSQAFDKSCLLPTDLESALRALEADTVLIEAMGDKLVEYFIYSKRVFELNEFAAFGKLDDDEQMKKEHEFYFFNA